MAMELPDTAAQPPETATILEVEGEAGTSTPENFSAPMQSAVPVNADLEATTFKAKGKEDESKGRLIDQQEAEVEEALARMQTDNDAEDEREEHRWLREEARGGDRAKDANNMVNRVKGAEVFVGGLQRMTTEEDLREVRQEPQFPGYALSYGHGCRGMTGVVQNT